MGSQPKLELAQTQSLLEQLGLRVAAEQLGALLSDCVKSNLSPHLFLHRLLKMESQRREERRISTSLKLSGLPPGQTLGNFDWSFQPGVGKTHLAVEQGFSVAFYRLEDLLHALKRDADVLPRRLKGKKYLKVALLIVDEVGFQSLSRQEAGLLFRLVSYRYRRGAMCITTNKSIKDWPEVLAGDEVMATALLDRLLHKCHLINIRGRSYRLKELEKAAMG